MLQRLIKIINNLADPEPENLRLPKEDYKLAAAALLVHATLVDGNADDSEKFKLRQLLRDHFDLSDQDMEVFIKQAERDEQNAVDLYGFTRRLTRQLDPEGRLEIIEMLWEIAFSDGVLHEYETHLIWRVAALMHVSTQDRIRLRQQVEARHNKT
ncbi:MAG: TerB family tellurite resistance protein [bacterium]|nr:TerB family tellurite resistance protein [bacterium]